MIEHKAEFSNRDEHKGAETERLKRAAMLSGVYARLFASPDGKLILADLQRKFGHARPRFDIRDRNHSTVTAALIDGQCSVLREIEQAIEAGGKEA